ncbi:hypothetical protein [Dictyobacter formicarum]|uniref:Uncharacterized protein n=1 Tax=Dictyobacter formicarum TaxID=2778368 RepID=A0ABQ3VNC1_9CHLR|nr:hypothetical protein [Dictyobacter formicarum]GHO87595.1 hypothetical protein KSZ_56010 [Dictyobacter formicarum]
MQVHIHAEAALSLKTSQRLRRDTWSCVGPAGEISLEMFWKHEEEQGDV